MIEANIFLDIVGGISLILYGIHLSGINLQKILGSYSEKLLKKANSDPLKGVAIGAGITALIHSSVTTTMMLIGLINGGFMELSGAIPVMLGANIGSTVATELASFQIREYALAFMIVGIWIHISTEKKIYKRIGEAIVGFGFLFLGMEFLFAGIDFLASNKIFVEIINLLAGSPLSAIFAGAFVTVILRSATATSILVVALGAASVINFPLALFMILGVNFGSSLKVIYLALKGKNFSGKIALIHLTFNSLGLLIFLIFFNYFYELAKMTSPDTGRQIANAHMLYNLLTALIFIPLVPLTVRIIEKISPPSGTIKKTELFYLDRKLICTPSVSLQEVNRGAVEMAKISYEMLEASKMIFFEERADLIAGIEESEDKIDHMTEKISEYMIQISQQNLDQGDTMKLYSLMRIVAEIEHLCDHIVAVSRIFTEIKKNKNIPFSPKSQSELSAVYGKLRIMQNLTIKSLEENNVKLAGEITEHENKVDEIIKKINASHINRLKNGECDKEAGKYFSKILYNLERIGDHYDNIAYGIIDRFRHEERS
jgi:phosphate:Na+ symporter